MQVLLFSWAFLGISVISIAHEGHDSTAATQATPMEATEHNETAADGHGIVEKFKAGKLIMEHISDAHDWHLFGHTHLPLPIILYSDKGLEVFSSSRLAHEVIYNGYILDEKNHIKVVDESGNINEEASSKIIDLSITKNVASLMFSIAIMLFVFISVAKAYTRNKGKAPSGLQSFIEPIIMFIRDDIAKSSIGEKNMSATCLICLRFSFLSGLTICWV